MSKLLPYEEMDIQIIERTTDPDYTTTLACAITQKRTPSINVNVAKSNKLVKFLFKANHTSVFEHSYATFLITNVSRSFLAQITRHRMSSFTAGSQHYQSYGSYANFFQESMIEHNSVKAITHITNTIYKELIKDNFPKEEARQILSNSKGVNILWTINARSLINFLNQRLCKRNVHEMHLFALKLRKVCINWWENLFTLTGPDCFTLGYCTQGYMQTEECKNENDKT